MNRTSDEEKKMKTGLTAAGIALLCVIGLAFASFAGPSADGDGDGVFNVLDNCSARANGPPNDCDTDDDGYGNYCDGDFNQSNTTTATDFSARFLPDFKAGSDKAPLDGTDMNCTGGTVTATDFSQFFLPNFKSGKPGPSGLHCAGTIPCDL
jgi:hypothetical protein